MRELFSLKNHHSVVPLCGFEVSRATKDAPCAACVSPFRPLTICGDYTIPDRVRVSFPSPFQCLRVSTLFPEESSPIPLGTRESVKNSIQGVLNGYDGLETSRSLISGVPGLPFCSWRIPQICTIVKIGDDELSTDRHLILAFTRTQYVWYNPWYFCHRYLGFDFDPCDYVNNDSIVVALGPKVDNAFSFEVEFYLSCNVFQSYSYGMGCEDHVPPSLARPMWATSFFRYMSQNLEPPFEFPIKLDLYEQQDIVFDYTPGGIFDPPAHIFLEEVA